jgi:CheY-like chemotaxis protein
MHNSAAAFDYEEFERLVRDGLANLFDLTALQTHPLTRFLPQENVPIHSRGEQLRKELQTAIEQLKPSEEILRGRSQEARPYQILRWRYIDGMRPPEIQSRLALSGRQFRRDHGRAVEAIAALLWDKLFLPDRPELPDQPSAIRPSEIAASTAIPRDAMVDFEPLTNGFAISPANINLYELIQGVTQTLQQRVQNEGVALTIQSGENLPLVPADRVILRQILISLLSFAIEASLDDVVRINCTALPASIQLCITFHADRNFTLHETEGKGLKQARYWAPMIQAKMDWISAEQEPEVLDQLLLSLPRAAQPILLAVDDQEIALRMYRRYLSEINVRLEGESDGSQVVEKARTLKPDLILLDVMMPNVDGWEILQALHAHPATCQIPVIICTVWEEPELAASLGAAGFLKKPFSQQDLLTLLARFGVS